MSKKRFLKIIKRLSKMILYTLVTLVIAITLFLNFTPTFGDSSKGDSLNKIQNSKNFNGKKFVNLYPTRLGLNRTKEDNHSILDFFFQNKKNKNPQTPLPSLKLNKHLLDNSITWLGHSTVLIKTNNITIITDPVFNRASPLPFGMSGFKVQNPTKIEDLPKIDVVVISHDHYDHLDYSAIKKLAPDVNIFFVPLGVKAHLLRWGVDENKIIEKDWYENSTYKNVNFTFAPTRHFSGRGLRNRDSTMWGSWIIKSKSQNIYIGGDGGYSNEFKKIGDNYGPFDIAFIENGAYNSAGVDIHMMPEQGVQASIDLRAKVVLPIHWAKFDLSLHPWIEPINRFTKEAKIKNVTVTTPLIAETFTLNKIPQSRWWENLDNQK